jgi:transporter family protein
MNVNFSGWLPWAVLSACFAALTAVLAKAGVRQIDPDVATFVRTIIIVLVLAAIVAASGKYRTLASIPSGAYVFLVLSALATGASWMCYFRALQLGDASRVAPVDKLSVVLVAVFGVAFLGERLSALNWVGIVLMATGTWLVTVRS